MVNTPQARKSIPDNYSCRIIFRRFATSMIHEHSLFLRADRAYFHDEGIGTPRRYFSGVNAGLGYYLRRGWPEPTSGARWNDTERTVEVFIDQLFLCHKCGEFALEGVEGSALKAIRFDYEYEVVKNGGGGEMNGVTVKCAQGIRAFCEAHLATKEFYFNECDDVGRCEGLRRQVLSHFRKEYGPDYFKERLAIPEPRHEVVARKKPEKLRLGEGYIYLVRCGEFHKIGLAKDANKRLSGLKTSSPFEMELIKKWRCKRPDLIERAIHWRFRRLRVRGEWFQLKDDILHSLLNLEELTIESLPNDAEIPE